MNQMPNFRHKKAAKHSTGRRLYLLISEVIMNYFKLDSNADHELSESGTSGTVYIAMPNDVSVEIYFETDDRQNINLLSVGDCYQEINGISEDYAYTLKFEHEPMIKAVVNQFLRDNPIDDSEPCEYDTMASLGFTNSDFLYG